MLHIDYYKNSLAEQVLMQYNDQQKNLQTYLNNITYITKAAVYDHLCRFIRENEYFWVRSNVEKAANNQYFCYIELVGYVHIGEKMTEMRIMIPHNYPMAPPQFDLVYNSLSLTIVNQGALVSSQAIYIRKNEAGQQLIRLNYECIRKTWSVDKSRHICQVIKEVCKQINNPPLLISNGYEAPSNKSLIDFKVSRNKSSGMSEQIIGEIQVKICTLQEKQAKVEAAKRQLQYQEARADFILRNGPKLQKSIKTQQNLVNKQLVDLRSRHENMLLNNSVNPLLQISEKDQNKISAVARKEALREAERKVTQCIERSLTESTSVAFDEHRNLIRRMYEEMFESQLQYLKLCD